MSRRKTKPLAETGPRVENDFLAPLRNLGTPHRKKSNPGVPPRQEASSLPADAGRVAVMAPPGVAADGHGMSELVAGEEREKVDIALKIGESDPPAANDETGTRSKTGDPVRTLRIEYYDAKLPEVESEVAFAAYYLGANLMASAEDFNQKFKNFSDANRFGSEQDQFRTQAASFFSIDRFIELGIIVGNLGALSLFPIPPSMREADDRDFLVLPEFLILGGLGEPGSLTRDDVRFVMTNVIYTMKSIQKSRLSTHLIGIHSRSLNIRQSIRAIVEGIKEGMERFDVGDFTLRVVFDSLQFPFGAGQIRVAIAHLAATFGNEIRIVPDKVCRHSDFTEVDLAHTAGNWHDGENEGGESEADDDAAIESNFMRLTVTVDHAEDPLRTPVMAETVAGKPAPSRWKDLKYSALTSNSAIPTRSVRIQNSFAEMLPNTVLDVCSFQDQWEYGNLMMHCFVPDDFQKLIDEGDKLTLVVDRETARIPWEMSGYSSKNSHKFFGTDLEISRQFRSTIGTASAHFPELNSELKILLIADPVSDGDYALEGAVEEAFALAELFADAQKAYGEKLVIRVHVRIGNERRTGSGETYRQDTKERFDRAKRRFRKPGHIDFQFCRPIEILKLLVHERFDIVHFAGHGKFVPETGEMGWMLDSDCTLTAREIFRVRQVPRLVFANACRSGNVREATADAGDSADSKASAHPEQTLERIYEEIALYGADLRQKALFAHMSMAEAFFARGIPNFLGTGWNVHDEQASKFALAFYRELIGLAADGTVDGGKSIGEALKIARNTISPKKGLLFEIFGDASEIEEEHESTSERLDHSHSYHNTWGAYQHYGLPTDRLFFPKNGAQPK